MLLQLKEQFELGTPRFIAPLMIAPFDTVIVPVPHCPTMSGLLTVLRSGGPSRLMTVCGRLPAPVPVIVTVQSVAVTQPVPPVATLSEFAVNVLPASTAKVPGAPVPTSRRSTVPPDGFGLTAPENVMSAAADAEKARAAARTAPRAMKFRERRDERGDVDAITTALPGVLPVLDVRPPNR